MASSNSSGPEVSRKDADFEKREAEDCRSLKDIKELLERKAKALDGVPIEDGGGACIGIYFSIANDLPHVTPQGDMPRGKWILDDSDNSITCCRCNCMIWANDICNGEPHYCPNCGALMY